MIVLMKYEWWHNVAFLKSKIGEDMHIQNVCVINMLDVLTLAIIYIFFHVYLCTNVYIIFM